MSILAWIVLGLIAGAIGKFLMPGRDPGGIIITIIIGIVGAVIGGFIGNAMGFGDVTGVNLPSLAHRRAGLGGPADRLSDDEPHERDLPSSGARSGAA